MSALRSAMDAAIEAAPPISFSRLGYGLRRRLFGWPALDTLSLAGKRVLVTGATSGLGLATATQLARLGAGVILVARDRVRGEGARRDIIEATRNPDVTLYLADLGSLAATRALAGEVLAREPRLDVLVHNAGALHARRALSPEGHELSFATMVLAPFALTRELAPLLEKSAPSRVILVSSGGMYATRLRLDDLDFTRSPYDGAVAYARAKRAQVVLAEAWSERLGPRGVSVYSMHPGWADTPGVVTALPRFHEVTRRWLRTPEQGADTIVWLAASPDPGPSGGFWLDRRPRGKHRLPWTRARAGEREALWLALEKLTAA
jgi:NAD(P)-dependent dehydrogenase (short-subunit alcohol dehydrogenase family)